MQEENRGRIEYLIDRYLEQRRVLNWSPRTIASYRSRLKVFTAYLASETEVEVVSAVTPDVLRRYQIYLYHWTDEAGRGRSFATQGARLSAMRSFMRDLVRTEELAHDPASTLALPKRRHTLPRVILTKREVVRLLAAPDPMSPLEPPVNTLPVRLPPCAAGASPTTIKRACASPKPGTGRPQ